MKIGIRIIFIFFASITLTLLAFIFTTQTLLKGNFWDGGINTYQMNDIGENVVSEIAAAGYLDSENTKEILKNWERKVNGINFTLLSENLEILYSAKNERERYTIAKLAESLSMQNQWENKEFSVLKEIKIDGQIRGYLLVIVFKDDFQAITLMVNKKGIKILGIIILTGLVMTVLISGIFALLFTYRTTKRIKKLNDAIESVELGNLDVYVKEGRGKDEIANLTSVFNNMSEKLKKQVEQDKIFQEERKKLVSNISHDLRTPLTSIIGYSESIDNDVCENEEEKKQFIQVIRKNALYMEKLLTELLEFSKLDSGRFEMNKKPTDIAELCRETLIGYLPAFQENDINLDIDLPDTPVEINIDADRISRVIRNLIENVIKYGSKGQYLGISIAQKEDAVEIYIVDHGEGIDAEDLEKVFERFYRADKGRNTQTGGMGLGLSISQEIVKKHGGIIKIKSQLAEGTSFIIQLPKSENINKSEV